MYPVYPKAFNLPSSRQSRDPETVYQQDGLGWQWYDPPEEVLPVDFCINTSLHGFHYIGQRKRHIFERIFWFAVVTASISTASFLIWRIYADNKDMPIITVFNPIEKSTEEIPFPAVTICNVNNIQKSKFSALLGYAGRASILGRFQKNNESTLKAFAALLDIYHICESAETFSEKLIGHSPWGGLGEKVKNYMFKRKATFEDFIDPTSTLRNNSQPCKEMILHCVWSDVVRDCSEIFQEVETDNGYCCTFNMIPVSLLLKDDDRDDKSRVDEWKKENITYDNILFDHKTKDRKYPFRQLYPGRQGGLSVLLNPDLDDYLCTNSDSKGFLASLHVPLDFPRMMDNGIAIPTGSEVMINAKPQITMTDPSIAHFSKERRKCYFDGEFILPHYKKYTTSNCMDECVAWKTREKCNCVRYYMPHNSTGNHKERICRPNEYLCTIDVRKSIHQDGLGKACQYCLPTCTEIEYHSEITSLPIIDEHVDNLFPLNLRTGKPSQGTILHVYVGTDSTFPRLRTESASTIELLSNAGGILGFCLGFSVLSLLEIVYYLTIRITCNWNRERTIANNREGNPTAIEFYNSVEKGGGWMPGMFPGNFAYPDTTDTNAFFRKSENVPAMYHNNWNYNRRLSPRYSGRNFH